MSGPFRQGWENPLRVYREAPGAWAAYCLPCDNIHQTVFWPTLPSWCTAMDAAQEHQEQQHG